MSLQTVPPVSSETIEKWQAQLDELFPKSEFASHLKIVWVSGDDWEIEDEGKMVWQGVERFYLFEMLPENAFTSLMELEFLEELKTSPRPVVRYDSVMKSVTRSHDNFTRLQWDLFRETGYVAKPYWVIQGSNGGSQRFFTQLEKSWLELQSLPTDPPLPGTLPYAPFDQRVIRQVLKHDKLRQVGNRLMAMKEGQKEQYRALQDSAEREFREAIVNFLKDQITLADGKDAVRGLQEIDAPRTEQNFDAMLDEAESRFVETGQTS